MLDLPKSWVIVIWRFTIFASRAGFDLDHVFNRRHHDQDFADGLLTEKWVILLLQLLDVSKIKVLS